MAGFLSPHWYLTVLGLLVFGLVLVFLFQQKRRLLSIWSFELPSWIVTREVLALFFFSLLALAYARPYIGYEDISLPDHGDDVVIVFDVSRSMAAEDVKPNRLVFAKRKLLDLIDLFQSRGQGDKVSLVLFAGTSYTFCPLTSDYGVLKTFVEAIELSLISSEGSNLNIALGQALKVLQEVESRYGRIVVITDGEDNDFSLQNVLESLGKGEVPISVLAVGTESGAPIPAGGGRFVKDDEGEIVISRLQSGALQELARETGGTFQIAQLGDGDLERLARSVNPLRATGLLSSEAESTTVRSYKEIGPLLVALALFVHFISIFLRSGRGFVIFVACAFFGSLGNARAELPSISSLSPYEAKQLYENGNFDEAEAVFSREIREHPDDVRSLQAYASTLFQKKDYKNARKYFEQAAQAAKLSKDRFENLYNAGTSALFGQEPEEAVPLLEESLKVKSNDLAAQENLNLARKLLEQKQEQQKQQDDKDKQKEKEKQQQQEQQQSSDSSKSDKNEKNDSDESESQKDDTKDQQQTKGEQGDKEENKSDKDEQKKESPASTPSQERGEKQGESSENSTDHDQADQQPFSPETGGESRPGEDVPLSEAQAQAWLDSLSDAPVLLQKQTGGNSKRPGGQRW